MMIKGSSWKVITKKVVKDDEGNICLGLCDYEKKTLYIEKGQTKEQDINTRVHEALHASIHELGVDIGQIAEEMLVQGLTEILIKNFRIKRR